MAALQDRRARLLASLYATFGAAATWTPAAGGAAVPVTIRRKGEETTIGFGQSEALVMRDFLKVRVSELAAPGEGDLVTVTETGETFRIVGEPRLVHAGMEWICDPGRALAFG